MQYKTKTLKNVSETCSFGGKKQASVTEIETLLCSSQYEFPITVQQHE